MSNLFVDDLSALVGFSGNPLDRLSNLRDQPDQIAAFAADPKARSLVFAGDIPLLKADPLDPHFTLAETRHFGASCEVALLGQDDRGPLFATLFETTLASGDPLAVPGRPELLLQDLRSLAVQRRLPREVLATLAQAKSLLFWHMRHRFCSTCGQPTEVKSAGWKRECTACKAQHFPRTDPVVIMLALRGDRCLLGRQARFTTGMYSALAGFVEPGETLEEAVRREIMEESGVKIGRVKYLASQPWPFPATLMVGCFAEALSDEVIVDRTELEDARWFSRDEVRQMLNGEHPQQLGAAQPIAIARTLLHSWVNGKS